MTALGHRDINALIVLATGIALTGALVLEYGWGFLPCPLCMVQRFWMAMTGAFAACALLLQAVGAQRKGWAAATGLSAVIGAGFAVRQLWLQALPLASAPACSLGVDYILEAMPVIDALLLLAQGSGDCAEVAWRFLGISIPGWVLLFFLGMLLLACLHLTSFAAERTDAD